MKKSLLLAVAATLGMAASAQTVIAPPTVEQAQAANYEALWGDYAYGYVLPNGTVLADNDDIKVVVDNGSASKPGANVSVTGLNTEVFPSAFNMGSAAGDGSFEPVYSLELISDGIKQPYAVFNVSAKTGGRLDMYCNRGNKKFTIYVWDRTVNEEAGTYVMANVTHAQDLGKDLVTKASAGLIAGHEYWIFCSGTGANAFMYQMDYTAYGDPNYSVAEFDATKYSTVIEPKTVADAQAAGYDALWGDYTYGYVVPNGTVLVDNEELNVVVDNGSAAKPGANVSTSNLNTKVFDRSFNMGSAAGNFSFEPVYSLELISDGIKQPYAVFTVDAKQGGALTMYSNRGNNAYTIYVWDITANEEAGTYALANSVQTGDFGKELVSTTTVGLLAGHKYWIFGSGTGANINMYAMGFNSYTSPNYSYSGSAGISDITVDAVPQNNIIYNFQGQVVDENYKGFVIKNGKKFLQK